MPTEAELNAAVEAERNRCAKIAENWLEVYGGTNPAHIDARTWACDAIQDIADAIRVLPGTHQN